MLLVSIQPKMDHEKGASERAFLVLAPRNRRDHTRCSPIKRENQGQPKDPFGLEAGIRAPTRCHACRLAAPPSACGSPR